METFKELTFHFSCRKPDSGILLSSPVICNNVKSYFLKSCSNHYSAKRSLSPPNPNSKYHPKFSFHKPNNIDCLN